MAKPVVLTSSGPNLLLRLIYFVFIGWWVGLLVSAFAWLLNVTILGLPFGLYLINRLPTIMTLRPQEQSWHLEEGVYQQGQEQRPFVIRALYFVLVGWWFSGIWLALAYLALVTILLIPLAFWMYGRVGAITTLYRS